MKRREFLGASGIGLWPVRPPAFAAQNAVGAEAFRGVGSRLRVTNMKVFGVSLTPDSDRPYVFVKLERHIIGQAFADPDT